MLSWLMGNFCNKFGGEEATHRENTNAEVSNVPATNGLHQVAHSAAIDCLTSVGKNFLLSGCKDGNLALFDCVGRVLKARVPAAHSREVTAAASAAPDGLESDDCSQQQQQSSRLCATASRDKSLRLWLPDGDANDSSQKFLSPAGSFADAHDLVVSAVDFNALDSGQVVTGSRDNTVKLWDTVAQKQIGSATVSRNLVTHIKWAPNTHQFLQASEDKELKLWDSRTLKVAAVFPRKQYIQTCCDFSPDGIQCVSSSNGFGGNGCEATVWDVRTKKPILELIGHSESVLAVCYHDSNICTGSADSTVRLWNPATGLELACLPLDGSGPINAVCSLPGLGLVGAATFNSGVCLCRVTIDSLSISYRY